MAQTDRVLWRTWFGDTWGDHLIETVVLTGLLIVGVVITSLAFRWE